MGKLASVLAGVALGFVLAGPLLVKAGCTALNGTVYVCPQGASKGTAWTYANCKTPNKSKGEEGNYQVGTTCCLCDISTADCNCPHN
jgi:hypothetical protein